MSVKPGELLNEQQGAGIRQYAWLWRDILLPLLLTRIFLTAVGFFVVNTMPLARTEHLSWTTVRHGWINTWSRWDAVWYLRIVRDGYFYTPGEQSSVAFFPAYPALMRLGGSLLGYSDTSLMFCGMVVANVMLLVAIIYLWKLVRLDFDEGTARRAVFYALIFPTTAFLSAVYPMSLILAIAVASFYHARRGQWWTAGYIAVLAPLARPDGVLLVPGLLFEYLRQRGFRWREVRADIVPMLALPAAALGGWMAYLHFRFGDALAFVHTQNAWQPSHMWPNLADWDELIGLMAALFSAAMLVLGWIKLRSGYMVYASLQWMLFVSAGRSISVPRFILVLFPVYMMLALFGRKAQFDRLWAVLSMGAATVVLLRFSLCYFVG